MTINADTLIKYRKTFHYFSIYTMIRELGGILERIVVLRNLY